MRLIVGLGNPDPEYQWTLHNLGFLAVDELASRGGIRVERPEGKALVGRGKLAGQEVLLAAQAGDAVELWLTNGIDAAMNKFNRRPENDKEEGAGK